MLKLMNDYGCAQLRLGDLELTVPNPMRRSLRETLEQEPSAEKIPKHKARMAAVDRELFPEDYPAEEISEDELQ